MQHLQLRLADGWKAGTGRVEIMDGDTWKVICDNDWDLDDSHVVCRQLGFPKALRWYPSRVNRELSFFNGLGICNGDESFLDQCLSDSTNCNIHSDTDADVAVECEGVFCTMAEYLPCTEYCQVHNIYFITDTVYIAICMLHLPIFILICCMSFLQNLFNAMQY